MLCTVAFWMGLMLWWEWLPPRSVDKVALHDDGLSTMDHGLLPSHRDIERVDDDERVEQTGDDQERVAVFVGDGDHITAAVAHRTRHEIRQAAGEYPAEFRQSNAEFQLVDWIHEAIDKGAGIVINPAGFSFHSIPVLDALRMFPGPIIEVHISNIHARDPLHRDSIMSQAVTAVIAGLGTDGYRAALEAMVRRLGA